jgi:hypothetical protein
VIKALRVRVEVFAMTTTKRTRSTRKVRRDWSGGKRGQGHRLQRRGQRIRRPDPGGIAVRCTEAKLTGVGGLVPFGAFARELGVDGELRRRFERLKDGRAVVYPMGAQLRLLMDAFAVGEHRPFGVEGLASDALFAHLAGGFCPSIDTIYRDLDRFDDRGIRELEQMVADHGLAPLLRRRLTQVHLDIDTTVTPVFGDHEGALPGPNPRYRGRPSYHPMLARIAETDTVIGAALRPGDTGFGEDDVPRAVHWLKRVREVVGPNTVVYVRVDAAADCTAFLRAIDGQGAFFLVKARTTRDLLTAVWATTRWTTVDWDADGLPLRQVAEIDFQRGEWKAAGLKVRVVAVRSRDRDKGRQLYLWDLDPYTVQVFLTNDMYSDADAIARRYDGRAGIEPLIAELKGAYGIGKVPTDGFAANHAALLLKMLTHNVLRRFVAARFPAMRSWRAPWLRRALLLIPGRLVRHGRQRQLRIGPRPAFRALE